MKKIRKLKVVSINKISINMLRVTFSHKDLIDFPDNKIGGYVKFMFYDEEQKQNLVRPYTIRDFRKKSLELDIDFAIHSENTGYATDWALNANIGDEIFISGPSPKNLINMNLNWFLFIGDMSALPAISVNLEELPSHAKGYAIIEILSIKDKQKIKKPQNLSLHWIINPKPENYSIELLKKINLIKWYDKKPSVWVACEFNKMRKLRDFFQKEKEIDKKEMYISSYWKSGLNQEQHKILKKEDSIVWSSQT